MYTCKRHIHVVYKSHEMKQIKNRQQITQHLLHFIYSNVLRMWENGTLVWPNSLNTPKSGSETFLTPRKSFDILALYKSDYYYYYYYYHRRRNHIARRGTCPSTFQSGGQEGHRVRAPVNAQRYKLIALFVKTVIINCFIISWIIWYLCLLENG